MAEKKKLKNLKRFRDGHRSFARKTVEDAQELIAGGNPIDVKRVNLLRTSLQAKYTELATLDRQIAELLDEGANISDEVKESCELTSTIQECIFDIEAALTTAEVQERRGEGSATGQGSSSSEMAGNRSQGSQGQSSQEAFAHARLPKLEMKRFYGNPIEWLPFWESFESAVHNNPNLSAVDNFNYLKSLLMGTANNVVAGLALTSANYERLR